jgi:kynureninase
MPSSPGVSSTRSRDEAVALDEHDALAPFAERFVVAPDGLIYLDGNSLGRRPSGSSR